MRDTWMSYSDANFHFDIQARKLIADIILKKKFIYNGLNTNKSLPYSISDFWLFFHLMFAIYRNNKNNKFTERTFISETLISSMSIFLIVSVLHGIANKLLPQKLQLSSCYDIERPYWYASIWDIEIHICHALQSKWTKKEIKVKMSQTINSEWREQLLHILDLRVQIWDQTVSSLKFISGLRAIVMFTLNVFVLN